MNSENIKSRFGSYGVQVLHQTNDTRLANLFSEHATGKICRTLALTRFLLPVAPGLETADTAIRAGSSIGATLQAEGWLLTRADACFRVAVSGERFATLSKNTVPQGTAIAMQCYTLQVSRDGDTYNYAAIAEAYHPEHIAPDNAMLSIDESFVLTNLRQQVAFDSLLSSL